MRLALAGELNPDLILGGCRTFPAPGTEVLVEDLSLVMGSSSAICAMGLARLGNQVRFIAKVGTDLWGDFCVETLERAGVDVSAVIRDPALKTGLTVSLSGPADRALVTFPGAIAALAASDVRDGHLAGCRHLHVSSFFLQDALRPGCAGLFRRARALGLTTSLDTGYDPSGAWAGRVHETIAEADLVFPNEVELAGLTGCESAEEGVRSLSRGRATVVAKLGVRGAMSLVGSALTPVPAFPVRVVDSTGAGDSFNAGFLHAWLRGEPAPQALRFGAACGALSTQALGGTGAQPTEEQVHAFLEMHDAKIQ